MSRVYTIPTNKELRGPIQNYVEKTDDLLGLKLMPFKDSFAQVIETEVVEDDEGMTAPHTLGADPKIDTRPGSKKYKYDPFYFKETDVLNEADILRARELGTFGRPISLVEEITKIAKRRARKTLIRVEWSIWQMLGGTLAFNENNVKVNVEWPGIQTHSPLHDWDNPATSIPLTDIEVAGDKFDGTGASMEGATVVANRQTWRLVMANQNSADIAKLDKTMWAYFSVMFKELAKVFEDKCGAKIVSYDKGYKVGGTFTKYLPYGQVRIIGKRDDGEDIGNWWRVPSLHITDAAGNEKPGYFEVVTANGQPSTGSMSDIGDHKNPKVEITGGVYGGPNMDFEDNTIKMTVASA